MSSIRLFILSAFEERGPLHGHALRLVADEEHIDEWADVTPGAVYGAIKRLAAEGLIAPVRVEREGNYPERQVFEITPAGRESLRSIRSAALETIDYRPDPFDLAMARLGAENLDDLRETLEGRLAELRGMLAADEIRIERIAQYLTLTEQHVVRHDLHRLRGEIAFHEELLEALPAILADESSRKGPHS
ncbi:PadR family transcriptional regulator [Salinibacterium soli]|uniref:Helix-turn-helix transcriptional regulator n=1 Tax=Antiquaquibacter soli TaxID=3064523 RepID=A0ABT9BKD2_9MICO|nr:helix-turn-helix transcriptional regulator [Protaetiibacter sp. WY-16]MDO7881459.1 helix-turn-helix transcriptional regulator [Protaetiibacter sp. WY-16]